MALQQKEDTATDGQGVQLSVHKQPWSDNEAVLFLQSQGSQSKQKM